MQGLLSVGVVAGYPHAAKKRAIAAMLRQGGHAVSGVALDINGSETIGEADPDLGGH